MHSDEEYEIKWKYDEERDSFFINRPDRDNYCAVSYTIKDNGNMTITYAYSIPVKE